MKDKVKVGVRVRPFNSREKALISSGGSEASSVIIAVKEESNQIALTHPSAVNNNNASSSSLKSFTFDHVFGMNGNQNGVFEALGQDLLSSAFEGYNACLFAYGQTGSGKSYTMLGSAEER
jgi:kinesin family protein 13